jgi:hypothetical protein
VGRCGGFDPRHFGVRRRKNCHALRNFCTAGAALITIFCLFAPSRSDAYDALVRWQGAQNAVGFRVHLREGGESYGPGIDVGRPPLDSDGSLSSIVLGLPDGVESYVAVSAYDISGATGNLSNEIEVYFDPPPPPPTPATQPGFTGVRISSASSLAADHTLTVSVDLDPGSSVQELEIDHAYDTTGLELAAVVPGPLADSASFAWNLVSPGVLRVALRVSGQAGYGGELFAIQFNVEQTCGWSTTLSLPSCLLDSGQTPCQTHDGDVTVGCELNGNVRHYPTGATVPGAIVALNGESRLEAMLTESTGDFSFDSLGTEYWQLEPRKLGGTFGAVSPLDAAYVLQFVAGARPFDDIDILACDVNGDGSVTALDATEIMKYAIGQTVRLPVATACGSDWAFLPLPQSATNQSAGRDPWVQSTSCQPGHISFDPLTTRADAQDFEAVLFGDCTGNWSP